MVKSPSMVYHTGTCDLCGKENIGVWHFNYHNQPNRDCRVCDECMKSCQKAVIKDAKTEELIRIVGILENFGLGIPEELYKQYKELKEQKEEK